MGSVRLSDAGYIFSDKWTAHDYSIGREIIEHALDNGLSRNWVASRFVDEGISYRRKDMFEDLSRVWATERSQSEVGYQKANAFFEAAKEYKHRTGSSGWYEPVAFARAWASESFSTVEQAEMASALAKEGYDPSPDLRWDLGEDEI